MLTEPVKRTKTIGISLENYRRLNQKRAELSIKRGTAVSFNDTIEYLLDVEEGKYEKR